MPDTTTTQKREQHSIERLVAHPHVLDLARRVHPTWVAAHGHATDPGVEQLAREIALCLAAIYRAIESGEDMSRRYATGSGIVVTVPLRAGGGAALGDENFNVCVIAGTSYGSRIDMGVA